METTRRFFDPPNRSFFLFGPRGTGKSTWLRHCLPGAVAVDLLDPETCRHYLARPERLMERVRAEPSDQTIIIDEVQKAPELLDAVHLLMEESAGRRFVLTGSSARKLRRGGVDLLGGRAVLRTLHPFMAAELGERFSLTAALAHGLVPLVTSDRTPADVLRGYVSLYLREEVQAEGLVRNIGAFVRFLEALSFAHANVLVTSAVAQDCQVERKVVEGYLSVVEDLLLVFRVPVFTRRAKRATTAHPKIYLFDAGVFRSLRPKGPLDRSSEIDGAALEGLVAQHLRAWTAYSGLDAVLSFWRTRAGTEVDFVVYGEDTFVALEVKNTREVRPDDLTGLKTFRTDYPEAQVALLYRGAEPLVRDGIPCLPVERFLPAVHPACRLEEAITSQMGNR